MRNSTKLAVIASLVFLVACLHPHAQQSGPLQVGICPDPASNCGPTLQGLSITPNAPSITNGLTVQLVASAILSDNTSGGIATPQCDGLWVSDNTGVATVSAQGLVTAVGVGSANVSCTLPTTPPASGSVVVQVVASPTIKTPTCPSQPCALPQASNGAAYLGSGLTFTAQGGTLPYAWDCNGSCAGLFPTGMSLSSGGLLSGTPTLNGTFTFSIRATDNLGAHSLAIQYSLVVANATFGPPNYTGALISTATLAYPTTAPNVGTLTGAGNSYTDPLSGAVGCRLTDAATDPSMSGNTNNVYSVSNSGGMTDNYWSLDDNLTLAVNGGNSKVLIGFDPNNLCRVTRPYATFTSGCPTGFTNCKTSGGFKFSGNAQFSFINACKLYQFIGNTASLAHFTFGSDVVPQTNSCSGGISGPPPAVTDFSFVENAPTGCVGVACNCLPSDFGAPTWSGAAGIGGSDTLFAQAYSSTAYHNGAATGQGSGYYIVVWSPTKGCMSYNTSTGSIHGDPGWVGGAGLTCSGTQCTGTATTTARFTIHDLGVAPDGSHVAIPWTTCLTAVGTCDSSDPWQWIPGTTTVYQAFSAAGNSGGHWHLTTKGIVNDPGGPIYQYDYRLTPNGGAASTFTAINAVPSPPCTTSTDSHSGYQYADANDTHAFNFVHTTNSAASSLYMPYDTLPCAWIGELDLAQMNGSVGAGVVYREGYNFNTGYSQIFNVNQGITAGSRDGKFISWGSDWLQNLRNNAGTSASSVPIGSAWKASKVYRLNYVVTPATSASNTNHSSFKVTVAGTASGTQPVWNNASTLNSTITDGGVTWTNVGTAYSSGNTLGTTAPGTDAFALQLR